MFAPSPAWRLAFEPTNRHEDEGNHENVDEEGHGLALRREEQYAEQGQNNE